VATRRAAGRLARQRASALTPAFAVLLALAAAPAAAADADAAVPRTLVVVCESHHHVLRHWLEAAAEGRLPASGVEVVHFDAHPDLGVPERPLDPRWRARPGALVAATDIETFQLAAVWVGLVRRVVWLRPDWARQLPDGERSFRLGVGGEGRLLVDDPSDYWVLEGDWAPAADLHGAVPVELRVAPLSAVPAHEPLAGPAAILDVDLDGFATRNPGADRLRERGLGEVSLAELRRIFARERLALSDDPAARQAEYAELVAGVEGLAAGGAWASAGAALALWRRGLGVSDLLALRSLLRGEAAGVPPQHLITWGRDVVGLPERGADPAEIEASAERLAALLRGGALRPRLVTIARSVQDGFTPPEPWPGIERRLLERLREALGDFELRHDRGIQPLPAPAS
jgi:hypothetical protein